ncbi:transglycosylase SLT domain-containing protein [Candidatus Parcubacteria bacterium]|nr:transglycosylase SLT domain-containing protein [Candidatus Parcubacteria bacterium]
MFRSLLPTPVPFVFVALLILNPLAAAWGNPVQTTTSDQLLPTEEAFPITAIPQKPDASAPKPVARLKKCVKLEALINKVAARVGVDKGLIQGIVYKESRCDPKAMNEESRASGLMGVTPIAQEQVGCGPINTPEKNLLCGTTYLSYLCEELEICDPHQMLLAYLVGPARMRKIVEGNPWAPYTHWYPRGVIRIAESYGS